MIGCWLVSGTAVLGALGEKNNAQTIVCYIIVCQLFMTRRFLTKI